MGKNAWYVPTELDRGRINIEAKKKKRSTGMSRSPGSADVIFARSRHELADDPEALRVLRLGKAITGNEGTGDQGDRPALDNLHLTRIKIETKKSREGTSIGCSPGSADMIFAQNRHELPDDPQAARVSPLVIALQIKTAQGKPSFARNPISHQSTCQHRPCDKS
jgi:hypothetical protein